MASAGDLIATQKTLTGARDLVDGAIERLCQWLERNDYRGYDTFDGLNAAVRPLTLEHPFLRTVLQQTVRRFPLNLRPLLGIRKERSTKGMGFLARGFLRMYRVTGNGQWADMARSALEWLMQNQAQGFSGASWGNHFDYQSRTFYLPKGTPTVVWTALIGHAFLDAYEVLHDERYLQMAVGACEHIVHDLEAVPYGDALCISYIPGKVSLVHNANTLGGSLLARTGSIIANDQYREMARRAMLYTAKHQHPDGAWFYGEKENLHWVDNFHTGYVLDCFKHYGDSTGDTQFVPGMMRGYEYWKRTFFLPDGTPRYYSQKTLPIDIQCSSQAIDTLVFFQDCDPDAIELAVRVARWTIESMQARSGYFYYRRYSRMIVNRTPTLHWGQATMLCALAGLRKSL